MQHQNILLNYVTHILGAPFKSKIKLKVVNIKRETWKKEKRKLAKMKRVKSEK